MIDRVKRLVLNDCRIKVAENASEYGISNESVYTIIDEHIGMSEESAMQVGIQKPAHARSYAKGRVNQDHLEVYNANHEYFHTHLVTGDVTWLHD